MEEHDAISYLEGYQEGEKVGIKKVVDWIRTGYVTDEYGCYRIPDKVLQAQLKSWGIKED